MKWTDEMTQTLLRMRRAGDSRANIARALGVTVRQVRDKVTAINDPDRNSRIGKTWRAGKTEYLRAYNRAQYLARKAKKAGA